MLIENEYKEIANNLEDLDSKANKENLNTLNTCNENRYVDLLNLKEQSENDFYGVVYDATFPSREDDKETSPYIQAIKLIGPGLNWSTNPEDLNDEAINVIIKSTNFKEFPLISEVGMIIRIHRGVYKPKKRKNVYLNLSTITKIRSSWLLFDNSSSTYQPCGSLTQKFSFDQIDMKNVEFLRKWCRNYFSNSFSLIFPKNVTIKKINSSSENDICCVVIEKQKEELKTVEEKIEALIPNYNPYKLEQTSKIWIKVMDESGICQLDINKVFDKKIREGDVLRIRSVKFTDKIELNAYSNLMKLPESFYLSLFNQKLLSQSKEFLNMEIEDNKKEEIKTDDLCVRNIRSPSLNLFKVNSITELEEFLKSETKYCYLKCLIVQFFPLIPDILVRGYNNQTNKDYSLREAKEKGLRINDYLFKTKIFCILDPSSTFVFNVILDTSEGEGMGLFGVEAGDCIEDYGLSARLSKATDNLIGIDKYCELILKKVKSYCISNLQIVGDYNNLLVY